MRFVFVPRTHTLYHLKSAVALVVDTEHPQLVFVDFIQDQSAENLARDLNVTPDWAPLHAWRNHLATPFRMAVMLTDLEAIRGNQV